MAGESQDDWKNGPIPLQHFRYEEENLAEDHRHVMFGYRSGRRMTDTDELGQYRVVDESGGDMRGWFLWLPEAEGVGSPPKYVSAWQYIWPCLAWTKDDSNRLNRTVGDDVPTAAAEGKTVYAFPIKDGEYKEDKRFAREQPSFPSECYPKIPGGMVGAVVDSSVENKQVPLWLHCDPRHVSAHHAGEGEFGSHVVDLNEDSELDPERCARLQSWCRVVKGPTGLVDFMGENALAWSIGESGLGDVRGGLVFDKDAGGGGTPTGLGPPVATIAAGSGGATAQGAGQTTTQPPGTPAAPATPGIMGLVSTRQFGFLNVGSHTDKHKIGQDEDGHPINSAHIGVLAYYRRNDFQDGPLHFEHTFSWPFIPPNRKKPQKWPYSSPVHLEWDPIPKHPFIGGLRDGIWKWRAQVPYYQPSSDGSPPKVITPPADDGTLRPVPTGSPFALAGETGEPPQIERRPVVIPQRTKENFSATAIATGFSTVLARPNSARVGDIDFRSWFEAGPEEIQEFDRYAPITGRIEAYGDQGQTLRGQAAWNYTQRPGLERFVGGTAPGGWFMLPPEVDMGDLEQSSLLPGSVVRSTVYFGASWGTFFASGLPDLQGGGVKEGWSWGQAINSRDLDFRTHTGPGASPINGIKFIHTDQRLGWYDRTDHLGILAHDNTAPRTWSYPNVSGKVCVAIDGDEVVQSGKVSFTAGVTSVPVVFATAYLAAPVVTVSLEGPAVVQAGGTQSVATTGFTFRRGAAAGAVTGHWYAVGAA